jgi:hypothetical protein
MQQKEQGLTSYQEKTKVLRVLHQPFFDSVDTPNALFYPKMAYVPKGKSELHVSFWPSELKKEKDIYTEFVDRDTEPEDSERNLWFYRYKF